MSGSVNWPGSLETPMRIVAETFLITSASAICSLSPLQLDTSSIGCANFCWTGVMFVLAVCNNPLLSKRKKCLRAFNSSIPSITIASRRYSAIPVPALPAPRITICWSENFFLVIFRALDSAPNVTAAVPWMSSLNVQRLSRYLSSIGRACGFAKSSHCNKTFGSFRLMQLTNLSTKSQ